LLADRILSFSDCILLHRIGQTRNLSDMSLVLGLMVRSSWPGRIRWFFSSGRIWYCPLQDEWSNTCLYSRNLIFFSTFLVQGFDCLSKFEFTCHLKPYGFTIRIRNWFVTPGDGSIAVLGIVSILIRTGITVLSLDGVKFINNLSLWP
jgi:hypothetical protein